MYEEGGEFSEACEDYEAVGVDLAEGEGEDEGEDY